MLDSHEHRAAPLPAGRDALQNAEENEQHGGRDADDVVGGQQPDQRGGGAHEGEGQHQHDPAAVSVAEVTSEERAERPEEEAQTDGEECQDLRHSRSRWGEEELPEDQAWRRGVEEEVVPLDSGADDGGDNDSATIARCCDRAGRRETARPV